MATKPTPLHNSSTQTIHYEQKTRILKLMASPPIPSPSIRWCVHGKPKTMCQAQAEQSHP